MKNMTRHFILSAIASLSFFLTDAQNLNRADKKLKKRTQRIRILFSR